MCDSPIHMATETARPGASPSRYSHARGCMEWAVRAHLIEAPHAQAGLAGAHVRAHRARVKLYRIFRVVGSLAVLAQHHGGRRAVGRVGRDAGRQRRRRLVLRQRALLRGKGYYGLVDRD